MKPPFLRMLVRITPSISLLLLVVSGITAAALAYQYVYRSITEVRALARLEPTDMRETLDIERLDRIQGFFEDLDRIEGIVAARVPDPFSDRTRPSAANPARRSEPPPGRPRTP